MDLDLDLDFDLGLGWSLWVVGPCNSFPWYLKYNGFEDFRHFLRIGEKHGYFFDESSNGELGYTLHKL